jgi:hypothetical protein
LEELLLVWRNYWFGGITAARPVKITRLPFSLFSMTPPLENAKYVWLSREYKNIKIISFKTYNEFK